jgi:hypothetical protein
MLISDHRLFVFGATAPPPRARASPVTRYLDHTQRRTAVGRTPLDEWSARHRDLYPTTHNTPNSQDIRAPGGIRTRNLSRRAAADLRLRPRGHWDRLLWPLEYLIMKYPVPTERTTVVLINLKSCNVFLHLLLASIRSYLKSVLGNKFLIFCIYVRKGVRIPGYFSKPKGVREQKKFGKHCYRLWYRVIWQVTTDFSDKPAAFIFVMICRNCPSAVHVNLRKITIEASAAM